MTLIDAVERWAQRMPDHPAHISGDRLLTYGELARGSNRLANQFLASFSGEDAHRPIAFYGHKEPELLIGFLAAVKSGHPYVPIDVVVPQQRVEHIMTASQALALVTPSEIAAVIASDTPDNPVDRSNSVAGKAPFYIMFTSGSTGAPKGVVITACNLESFVEWMLAEQKFAGPGEVFLDQAPFSFDLSVMDLFPCLVSGGTLFSIPSRAVANPAELFRMLSQSQLTTWVSTPSFVQMCLIEKHFSANMLPHLRRFLFCGETLAPDVAARLLDRFPAGSVWNTYGPTEATVATTSVQIDRRVLQTYTPLPVGSPKPDSRIVIMADSGEQLADGHHGEIVIAGNNVSPGYLGRADLTDAAFFDLDGSRAYRTGDQGYFRDGWLFFEGRRDQQIKLRGHRVELGDIEAHLQALAHVRDAIVVVRLKTGVAESLSAFVIFDNCDEPSDDECARALRDQLGERLPAYMIPRRFYFLSAFPMTPNGKADRKKLAEMQS